jgi:hypothetical protein
MIFAISGFAGLPPRSPFSLAASWFVNNFIRFVLLGLSTAGQFHTTLSRIRWYLAG